MTLRKCYQNILTYESVKLMKTPVSMYTLMKVLRLMYPLNTNDEIRNRLLSSKVLIREDNFNEI